VLTLATVAVNPAAVWPAETVTLAGTVKFALLLDTFTVAPPAAAGAVSVTVQLEVPGAFTLAGEQFKELGCTATVRPMVAVWPIPFNDAVTVTF
jgi:hypothetical protein